MDRVNEYADRVAKMDEVEIPKTKVPMIPVRAHFRRSDRFLGKYPATQKAILRFLKRIR